jgi:hypothetical protein
MFIKNYFKEVFSAIRSLLKGMKRTGYYFTHHKEIITQQYPDNRDTLNLPERFKGEVVMERVYEPDWTTDARVDYTNSIADILAEITPTHINPSIQTAPLAFKPNVAGEAYIQTFTDGVFRVVKHLRELEERTGRRVKLALEPDELFATGEH